MIEQQERQMSGYIKTVGILWHGGTSEFVNKFTKDKITNVELISVGITK